MKDYVITVYSKKKKKRVFLPVKGVKVDGRRVVKTFKTKSAARKVIKARPKLGRRSALNPRIREL